MRLRTAVPMMLLALLCACGAAEESAQTPIRLRTALNEAGICAFRLELQADFGDHVREYTLDCTGSGDGDAGLTVLEPELAAGITASVSGDSGEVSYGDTVLAVERFSTRDISPMAAPGLLTAAWGKGYVDVLGRDGEYEQVHYLLGYGGRQLEIVTWFSGEVPVRAEITDGSQRLISCEITDFTLQKRTDEHGNDDAPADLGGGGP